MTNDKRGEDLGELAVQLEAVAKCTASQLATVSSPAD